MIYPTYGLNTLFSKPKTLSQFSSVFFHQKKKKKKKGVLYVCTEYSTLLSTPFLQFFNFLISLSRSRKCITKVYILIIHHPGQNFLSFFLSFFYLSEKLKTYQSSNRNETLSYLFVSFCLSVCLACLYYLACRSFAPSPSRTYGQLENPPVRTYILGALRRGERKPRGDEGGVIFNTRLFIPITHDDDDENYVYVDIDIKHKHKHEDKTKTNN